MAQQTHPLVQLWARNQELTGYASEHVRTSALAGLAVSWLFTGASHGDLSKLATAPKGLLVAAGLFAASLALDILHYYVGAMPFKRLAKAAEAVGKSGEDRVAVPTWAPGVAWFFYNGKVLVLFAGYAVLVYKFLTAAFG